ncbi:MAG: DUF3300 domain-containing protein [Syntrophobacteraceae bacterium]
MNGKAFLKFTLIGVLTLVLAVPPGAFAQSSGASAAFTQEELDQMLAPIALYPDSLLAQVLVAATYPEQVSEADRWVKENASLQGERLNDAVDNKNWDLSVKALVPFPKVLDMMSAKQEWTQRLGEAFLAQEADVMDSVQHLRSKAHAQGNLKTTREQRVVVKGESFEIEPVNPEIVYVPAYNPAVVYGTWWHPAHPPYLYSPWYPSYVYDPYYTVPGFIAAGAFGFAAAVTVGSFWHHGWGRWDWGRRNVVVNVNRTVNINRVNVRNTRIRTTNFNTAVRQGKVGSPAVRNAAQQRSVGKRPTAANVQRDLQRRQGDTRVGGKGSRGSTRDLSSQRGTQRNEKGVTRDSKAVTRTGKSVSRGEKGTTRGGQKSLSRERTPSRTPQKAVRSGGGARPDRAVRSGGSSGGISRGGGAARGGSAPHSGGGAKGGGAKGGGEKREHR